MEWLQDDKDGRWTCDYCKSKKLEFARNCDGKGDSDFKIKLYYEIFNRCPLNIADDDAWEVVNIVLMAEGGGMGVSRIMPSQIMDETNFWWNVRSVIIGEQNKIEKLKPKDTK